MESKKRPYHKPCSILIPKLSQLSIWAEQLSEPILRLAEAFENALSQLPVRLKWITMPNHPEVYQRCVYAKLHELKLQGYTQIWIEHLSNEDVWAPVIARLNRWCQSI